MEREGAEDGDARRGAAHRSDIVRAERRCLWAAVALVSLAAAAHQWWSGNLFTSVSDMFPRRAVASVMGIGGFVGAHS